MATKKETAAKEQQEVKETTAANEAEKILEEARAKAAEIVANAEAEAKAAVEAAKEAARQEATAAAPAEERGEKLVPIRLFKDNEKYKDDVFVAVNGRSFQIKRGETVMVPDYVATVLEQSMAQDMATANLIEAESSRYEAEAKARNL